MKFLFTSDWHLRMDAPKCRMDDFLAVQEKTIDFIFSIAEKNDASICHAGDLFHRARPEKSQELEIMLIEKLKSFSGIMYLIPGQHDLLYHKEENYDSGSIGVISTVPNIECHKHFFGKGVGDKSIAMLHKYCEAKKLPFYIQDGVTATYLLEKQEDIDIDVFVVGDNHKSFVYQEKNRFVFNCGCMIRQNVSEKDYEPCVYLYDDEIVDYEKILLPDQEKGVIDNSHIEKVKDRDERIDAFINKLKSNINIDLDFESNIKNFLLGNKVSTKVKEKVYYMLQEARDVVR